MSMQFIVKELPPNYFVRWHKQDVANDVARDICQDDPNKNFEQEVMEMLDDNSFWKDHWQDILSQVSGFMGHTKEWKKVVIPFDEPKRDSYPISTFRVSSFEPHKLLMVALPNTNEDFYVYVSNDRSQISFHQNNTWCHIQRRYGSEL